MANALYQSKLIGSFLLLWFCTAFFNIFLKLLFGLGKCSFWLVSWQFFPSFFWSPQIHKLSQTPLSFHRLSGPWKAYPPFSHNFQRPSKTVQSCIFHCSFCFTFQVSVVLWELSENHSFVNCATSLWKPDWRLDLIQNALSDWSWATQTKCTRYQYKLCNPCCNRINLNSLSDVQAKTLHMLI